MEKGLKIPPNERTKTTNSILISLMKQLEKATLLFRGIPLPQLASPFPNSPMYSKENQLDGTQIRATMFNEAAKKFYPRFELGKVYYISKGSLKVANKQFATVRNNYEITLNEYSEIEEVSGEGIFVPETKYDFVKIENLGSYVNGRELVDIVGVVQNVSSTLSIRRKINNETIQKHDITITDDSKKTVVISLWNDLATNIGQELMDTVDTSPVVAIKHLKVGDFQGVTLSTLSKSTLAINPYIPEAKHLRSCMTSKAKILP